MTQMSARELLRRSDRGEVGVGTLIVFIAMVLVAAVAAAVIIGTTGSLQQRASETGKEATEDVASNFHIVGFFGVRNSTSTDIYTLKSYMELASGAKELDMSSLVVRYSDGTSVTVYAYNGTNPFNLTWLRGTNINNVIKANDLVEVSFNLGTPIAPRSEIEIHFIPEKGSTVQLNARTPATYGTQTTITLR